MLYVNGESFWTEEKKKGDAVVIIFISTRVVFRGMEKGARLSS
jgi:hypothetical protein